MINKVSFGNKTAYVAASTVFDPKVVAAAGEASKMAAEALKACVARNISKYEVKYSSPFELTRFVSGNNAEQSKTISSFLASRQQLGEVINVNA